MEHLPNFISILFVLTTFLTVWLLYKASNYNKPAIIIILIWLALQAAISLKGFYTITNTLPPRFALLLVPPLVFIILLFLFKQSRKVIDGFSMKTLTLLHVVRIPVELGLFWLCLYKVVPQVMTFEGSNFDIFCGLTAPLVYYFGYVKTVLSRGVLIAWNVVCLLLLANIVITALLSGPFIFQRLAFGQPNIALLYFPFIWLPCCIVPVVLFAHVAVLRGLILSKMA